MGHLEPVELAPQRIKHSFLTRMFVDWRIAGEVQRSLPECLRVHVLDVPVDRRTAKQESVSIGPKF